MLMSLLPISSLLSAIVKDKGVVLPILNRGLVLSSFYMHTWAAVSYLLIILLLYF